MYSSRNDLHFFFLKCVKSIYKAHMHTHSHSVLLSHILAYTLKKEKKKGHMLPFSCTLVELG